jgi:hypothetical protein
LEKVKTLLIDTYSLLALSELTENNAHFFSCTISETIVLITPILPFSAPPMVLNNIACQNVLENPKPRHEMPEHLLAFNPKEAFPHILVPSSPIIKTSFLPPFGESDIRPHIIAVRNCAPVKLLANIPACLAIVESGRLSSKDFS